MPIASRHSTVTKVRREILVLKFDAQGRYMMPAHFGAPRTVVPLDGGTIVNLQHESSE